MGFLEVILYLAVFINIVLFAYLNAYLISMKTILLDYTQKTNMLMCAGRVNVPSARLVKIWEDKYKEAANGSIIKQAYKVKLDEYKMLTDGDRYSE